MADEYTPTTSRVRADYAETYEGTDEKRYARFDRWLAGVERAAAARALDLAASDWAADPDAWGDNEKDYRNELRARAAEMRGGRGQ